ncbi:MAG TPA: multidrug ABC transporter permease [Rhodospirillaceae bacterium]|nr:multidrug ABC transporter permease [Rhodospirillaceae bacterium]
MKTAFKKIEDQEEEDVFLLTQSATPKVREIGSVNWRGLWTLIVKEVERFVKISIQTIVSPLVMTVLFYAVFSVSMGSGERMVGGVPFLEFLIPGLVIMSMAQSSFFNTASSLILSKLQGNLVDVLMPPLSPLELTIGYALGGVLRGLAVGIVAFAVMSFFYPLNLPHPAFALYFAVMGSLMLSLIGLITGLWGDRFDHLGAIQNFVIMPATFLSGSFFSIQELPKGWDLACTLNPFFYMIDGFRYGFTGHADASVYNGIAFLLIINMALFNVAYWMFNTSSKIKP